MRLFKFVPTRVIGVMFFFMIAWNAAIARDDGTDSSFTIEKDLQTNVINGDGSFVLTYDTRLIVNEERAVKTIAQRSISYNHTLETLDVIEAYTEKSDGRKVVVQSNQIKDQQERRSSDAPMFQDTRIKVVIFPDVAVGDRLVLRYKKNRTIALFPGQFEDLSTPAFHPTKQFTLIYDLPDGMPLYADAKGFLASTPAGAPGRKVYRWDYVHSEKARIEQGAVSYLDYGQYLAVSTFANFGVFAHAYDVRAKEKSQASKKLSELAHTIAGSLNDSRAKAIALNDWVRKNIRYVAVYIGAGGVVPHAAETVLDNRYGDCKDHVAILEALLSAVGIDSTPALINASNAYTLQRVPTLGVLNHVITYVPSLNLYLDSTADSIAGGYLPVSDLGKPVVLTKTGTLANTPSTQDSNLVNKTVFKISPSGAADFSHSSTSIGWEAEPNRYNIRNAKSTDRDLLVQKILAGYGQKGAGVVEPGRVDDVGKEYEIKIIGRTENFINLPGPIGVQTLSSLAGGIDQTVFGFAIEKERAQAFVCISGEKSEQSRFEFPSEFSIIVIPKPVVIHGSDFYYTSDYIKENNTVVVSRHYRFRHSGAVCNADEFKNMQPTIDAMIRDLRSQIIVQAQ